MNFIMIFLIAFLLMAEGARQQVSSYTLENEEISGQLIREFYQQDENSILDTIRNTKASKSGSKRNVELSTNPTQANVAINQTISDYHAQRQAVMDRYYARQREIVEKFARKTRPEKTIFRTTVRPTMIQQIFENSTSAAAIESTTVGNYNNENYKVEKKKQKLVSDERKIQREEQNNSSDAWIYRSNNWNPRVLDSDSDIDLQPESSNTLERSVDRTVVVPGYYKLGNFIGSKDEKVVYQHNLGVGLKGSSQLDATFEAVIEGPYEITIVEAFPYANTRANFTWLGGGPGTNFVKLKLQGYENEGFSYTVIVWGIPKNIL